MRAAALIRAEIPETLELISVARLSLRQRRLGLPLHDFEGVRIQVHCDVAVLWDIIWVLDSKQLFIKADPHWNRVRFGDPMNGRLYFTRLLAAACLGIVRAVNLGDVACNRVFHDVVTFDYIGVAQPDLVARIQAV